MYVLIIGTTVPDLLRLFRWQTQSHAPDPRQDKASGRMPPIELQHGPSQSPWEPDAATSEECILRRNEDRTEETEFSFEERYWLELDCSG